MDECDRCEELLQPYLDRVLTDSERAQAEVHLEALGPAVARPGVDAATIFDVVASTYVTEVADAQPGAEQDYTLSMFDVNQSAARCATVSSAPGS